MYVDGIKVIVAQWAPEDETELLVQFPDGQYIAACQLEKLIDPECGKEGCVHELLNQAQMRLDYPGLVH